MINCLVILFFQEKVSGNNFLKYMPSIIQILRGIIRFLLFEDSLALEYLYIVLLLFNSTSVI